MKFLKSLSPDLVYLLGLLLIAASLFAYNIPSFFHTSGQDQMGDFMGNYLIAAFYFIILLVNGRLRRGRSGIYPLFLFLILFLISAYSLNRQMTVFERSTPWFTTLEVIVCVNYLLLVCFDQLPRWTKHLVCFIAGVALVVFTYLSVYLTPLYGMSLVGFFLLGIPLHSFVPALFVIYTLILLKRLVSVNRSLAWSVGTGAGSVLLIIIVFSIWWSQIVGNMNRDYRQAEMVNERGLPAWVVVAQKAPQNLLTEKILKTGLVYSIPPERMDDFFWRMPSRSFGEQKQHDPLVMIAAFFDGRPALPEEDRIKVLEAMYDSRHQAQRRLWKGDDLYTENVKTTVRIWPELHLSYTEKSITVTNGEAHYTWRGQQEAIYTFHLPEGAFVSSLSLWIDGKEAKGVLSSKEKADSAYNTIVGQRHDPSVVHWQEGNTVSVRVFPVLSDQSRLFTIGITAPLEKQQNRLIYRNIYFDGPSATSASENISLRLGHLPKDLSLPSSFNLVSQASHALSNGASKDAPKDTSKDDSKEIPKETPKEAASEISYSASGSYNPGWEISFRDEGVAENSFSFSGQQYSIKPYQRQREEFLPETVYLDINQSWSHEEFEKVWEAVKGKKVYAYSNKQGMENIGENNREAVYEELSAYRFSLFPLQEIETPSRSLLISRSGPASPSFGDLDNSPFKKDLQDWLSAGNRIRLFDLGTERSPYLKALKEFRALRYEQGDPALLKELLTTRRFAADMETDSEVVVENAGILIDREPGSAVSTAPDHLMRLFAYNHILQKTGSKGMSDSLINAEMVNEARQAYVVSPVSSLIVLETQKDYDRFNIEDSKNSLKNATLKSKGAVPEPQEWALLIMVVLVLFYARFRFNPVKNKIGF